MAIMVWVVIANVALVGALLLVREYEIAVAWRRVRATLSLDRSRPLVAHCYELLVQHYGSDTFAGEQLEGDPRQTLAGIERYQQLAELAGKRWQVTLPPLVFRLVPASSKGIAGSYSRAAGCGYSFVAGAAPSARLAWTQVHEIGLASDLLSDSEALPVVIAHEISHLVLHRDGVTTGNAGDDEILTDVATALIGFGAQMRALRSRTRRVQLPGRRLGWQISGPGYLHAEEIEYLLELHDHRMANSVSIA